MKQLNKKIFVTIFSILSFFLILFLIILNVGYYNREYRGISHNLNVIDNHKDDKEDTEKPAPRDFENMMIMDYEVYTIKLNNNEIDKIISHSSETTEFNVEEIAKEILAENDENTIKIGNLYVNNYAYNLKNNDSLVILNTASIKNKLTILLIESILLFIMIEILIYLITIKLTKWICKPAEEAFIKQKDFIADASHELKTPLAVIMASSDELKTDKKNSKYIDNIKYESERMSTLISSLLDLSKLENGVSISTYKKENISKIIEKTCLTFEALAFEKEIEIKNDIDEDIIFNCSKDEIERLISIILDNAIKHSYNKTTIKVNAKNNKNNIDIEIINCGDALNPGDEEKIFERFYRADKARSRKENRYGLGLAIAKNIVLNHKGTIKAFSKNGKTTFKINFKN